MHRGSIPYDLEVKTLVIGDSGVGKTSLLCQFCEKHFDTTVPVTVAVDYYSKIVDVNDKKIKLQIWDTAGQERYRSLAHKYYQGAMGIILSYSVTDRISFENIETWVKLANEHGGANACKILVGSKTDMPDRVVGTEEGRKLAELYGIKFFETSAKEGVNVSDTFEAIAKEIEQNIQRRNSVNPQAGKIQLHARQKMKKKNGCCS